MCTGMAPAAGGASFFDFLVRQKYDSPRLSPTHETGKLTKAPICIIP